ncbi:MAG: ricin-type beta-trefoil lectin domain protein [Limimaricola soesokkakensis]|uniref:ricin-type beta-trefoil lectin domain protein n=1 Tax=Limimaricola soesokkakensis TaxID=1343159 RepID=UPI004059C4BF
MPELTSSPTRCASLGTAVLAAIAGSILPQVSLADSPVIQTDGPIIYLSDNLDEEANLGWCIDTEGRGESDQLHAHSCKPTGDDVLFSYAPQSARIESATYAGLCMAYNAPDDEENPFGLIACDDTDPNQRFEYDTETGQIHPGTDETQCVTVSAQIDDAGPFQSRDLLLAACDDLDQSFKTWTVRD